MVFNKLIWVAAVLTLLIKECDSQLSICGQPALNTRIVGGEEASPGSWPWMVSLHIVYPGLAGDRCGGSLINDQWVLTAAYCVSGNNGSRYVEIPPSNVTAYLGRQSQEGSNPNEVMRKVAQIIHHPNYNFGFDNEIALLKLSEPVSFTSYISPVCLAASDSTISIGVNTWITGWGDTGNGVPLPSPKNLMEVELEVVDNSQCSFFWFSITDNMMCAKSQDGGKGFCRGDYGVPMVSKQCDRWIQAGIANEYRGCSQNTLPGLYTRVSQYESWINSVINTTKPSFISFTSTDSCPPKLCGHARLGSRILNGSSVASAGEWPWMASVQKKGQHVCGGTLVSESSVLTDGSCFSGSLSLSEWKVKLGRLTQNGSNPVEVLFNVVNITMSNQTGNNLAVLKLSPQPTLNDYIQPICLSNGRTFSVGSVCWAAGWSSGRGGEEQPLYQFQTTVLDCGNGSSTDILCTELFTLEQGDYGGPLMCRENETWFQKAVLSLGNNSSPAQPMIIFDKLDRFQSFLEAMSLLTPMVTDNSRSIFYSPFFLLGHLLLFSLFIQVFT